MSNSTFKAYTRVWGHGPDGMADYALIQVEIEIDLRDIASYLGTKAVRNKSRKSKALSGAVVVRATDLPKGWKF